jgi:hypothetical protein
MIVEGDWSSGAAFSEDGVYRYGLWRGWDPSLPMCAWIGLNPSTADATTDDPTIRRCIAFSKRWGYGKMHMLNLFAYRATFPRDMMAVAFVDPVGPENDRTIAGMTGLVKLVVVAWGVHGTHMRRDLHVLSMLSDEVMCLGFTKNHQPRHPLYVDGKTKLVKFRG